MKLALEIFLIIAVLVASFEATAIDDHHEILRNFENAKKFLCDNDICPEKIPTIYFEEKEGYSGFFDHNKRRISISPQSESFETQLTLAHEIVHVYRKQFNLNEEKWLEEGLAKVIELQFSTLWPVNYTERLRKAPVLIFGDFTANGKNNFAPNGNGYPSSFYFTFYLYKHFGAQKLLKKLLTSSKSGWDNVISAIHELIKEKIVFIPAELISKESILRHFAVSLWVNNMYIANYALFQIDKRFESLASLKNLQFSAVENTTDDSMKIQFHPEFQNTNAQKVYSIISYDPFIIKEAEPTDKALIFIYLFY